MSLTEVQAQQAVYLQWKTAWDVLHPGFPYCFENESFKEPTETPFWARVTLRPLDSTQDTLGRPTTRQFKREAAVWVQLFGPLNQGMTGLRELVDDARGVFEGAAFGGVDPAGGMRKTTPGSDGRWYEVVVVAPVTYYETR